MSIDNDDALMWVCPALSIGYSVVNDPQGRLRFYTEDVEIIWRCGKWIGRDIPCMVDPHREYKSLHEALVCEA